MAVYEIKNYIKLISIRIDHFESHLIQEINTVDIQEIEKFINRYTDISGVKIIIIEMNTQETITFDDVKKIIHNAHIFDYLRNLVSDGNKLINCADNISDIGIGSFIRYMLNVN